MRVLGLLVLSICISSVVSGQTDTLQKIINDRQNSSEFRDYIELLNEPTNISGTRFFDYHSGIKKAYLFNGDFQMPFTIGGNRYISGKRRSWFHAFQFVPEIKVRIFQNDSAYMDKSKPVRTPSYIPKISYFLSNEKWWNPKSSRQFYLGFSALHHSNGGDGWEFNYGYDSTVNIYDGSFSESLYFQVCIGGLIRKELNYQGKKNRLHHNTMQKNQKVLENAEMQLHKLGWKVTGEFHPRYFANQKFYDSQLYGGNRIICNLFYQTAHRFDEHHHKNGIWHKINTIGVKENYRFSFQVEYITDLSYRSGDLIQSEKIKFTDASKRLNVCLSFYKRLFDSHFLSAFAQLAYYGSDNYNIYFQQSLFTARMGLAFAFFEFDLRN